MEIFRMAILMIVVLVSSFSLYFSRIQGAKIRIMDVYNQVPMSNATHTVIISNYGNKTGVVIGPDVNSAEDVRCEDKDGENVLAIEPHGTVVREVEVSSDVDKNFEYQIKYKTHSGKAIQLPKRTFLGSGKNLGSEKKEPEESSSLE